MTDTTTAVQTGMARGFRRPFGRISTSPGVTSTLVAARHALDYAWRGTGPRGKARVRDGVWCPQILQDEGFAMANMHLTWWGCGAFDVRMEDVCFTFDPYLFGDQLERSEPVYDYIFISHEHFDHCNPRTLEKLCQGGRFKTLFVSSGCVHPDLPVAEKYGAAASERDLPVTRYVPRENVRILYPKHRDDEQRGRTWEGPPSERRFPGPCEADLGPITVETIESGENQRADLPTNGYLVRHKEQQVSFLHTGDLHRPFPALRNLRGEVDFLIHMKLGLTEYGGPDQSQHFVQLLNLVRPRFVVPIHYRTDRSSDPIPHGTWPPDVMDVAAFIESVRAMARDRSTVLPFTAGVEYEVQMPEKQVLWKWEWRQSWTEPTWL